MRPSKTPNATILSDMEYIGLQLVIVVAWPLVWGRNPWPVLGAGAAVSALVATVAYVMLRAGAGLL